MPAIRDSGAPVVPETPRRRRRRRRPTTPGPGGPSIVTPEVAEREQDRRESEKLRRSQRAARLQRAYAPPTQRAPGQGRRRPRPPSGFLEAVGGDAGRRIATAVQLQRRFDELIRPRGPSPGGTMTDRGFLGLEEVLGEEWNRLYQNRRAALSAAARPADMGVNPEAPELIQEAIRETHEQAAKEPQATLASLGQLQPTGLAQRTLGQVLGSLLYTPAGLYMVGEAVGGDIKKTLPFTAGGPTARGTADIATAMGQGIWSDITNPTQNLGYLLTDIWGLAGAGAGIASRAGRAARTGSVRPLIEGVPAGTFQTGPRAGARRAGSALGRVVENIPQMLGREGGIFRGPERRTGFEATRAARRGADIEEAQARGLEALAGKTSLPKQTAIRGVAEQTPLELRIERHRTHIADAEEDLGLVDDPKERARLKDVIRRNEEKVGLLEIARDMGYTTERGGRLSVSDELAREYELTRASAGRKQEVELELGTLDPVQARLRIDAPGRAYRGGEYVDPETALARQRAMEPDIRAAEGQVRVNVKELERQRGLPEVVQAGKPYKQARKRAASAFAETERLRPAVAEIRAVQDELIRLGDEYQGYIGRQLSDPAEMKTLRNLKARINQLSNELGRRLPVIGRYQDAIAREIEARQAGATALEGLVEGRQNQANILNDLRRAAEEADLELNELVGRQHQIGETLGWQGGEGPPGEFYGSYASPKPGPLTRGVAAAREGMLGVPRIQQHRPFTGEAIPEASFRDDIMRTTAEGELSRLHDRRKLTLWNKAKDPKNSISPDEYFEMERTNPKRAKHYRPVRTTSEAYSAGDRSYLAALYDKRDQGMMLTKEELKEIAEHEQGLFEHLFPKKGDARMEVLSPTETQAGLATAEGRIRFYDARTMPQQRRVTAQPDKTAQVMQGIGSTADLINQLASMSLLFTKGPGYVTPNMIGQVALLAIRQGLAAPLNLMARAPRLVHSLSPDRRAVLRGASGGGFAQAIVPPKGPVGAITRGTRAVANVYGKILDDPFRDAAFVYEARKLGYKNKKDIEHLLDEGASNPASLEREHLDYIRQGVDQTLGEFGRMGQGEQDILRRLIFFYPWLKASTLLTGRLAIDRPVTASALAQVGRYGQEQTQEQLGADVAAALPGVFPTGDVDEQGNPRVIDPRSVAIFQSPSEIAAVAGNLLMGQPPSAQSNIGAYLTPAVSAPLAGFLGYDAFRQRQYPADMGFWDRLGEEAKGLAPPPLQLLAPEFFGAPWRGPEGVQEGRLYGYQPGDPARRVFGGGQMPRSLNRATAEEIAAKLRVGTPRERVWRKGMGYRTAYFEAAQKANFGIENGKLPKEIQDAFNREAERWARVKELEDETEGDITYKQRYGIDIDLLERWKVLTPKQADFERNWMETASEEEIRTQRQKVSQKEMGDAYLDLLGTFARQLKERGQTVPDRDF